MLLLGQNYSILPPERGERQLGKILEMLAILEPAGDMSLLGLVSSQINNLTRGSTIILITPSNDDIVKLGCCIVGAWLGARCHPH